MKRFLIFAALIFTQQFSYSQNINIDFRSQLDFTSNYSSLFGYVDDLGNEYALLGTWEGVSVINVTDPDNPVTVANIPSAISSNPNIVWREIKTFNHHAYVTNERDSALLIIDLTNLPNNNISYHHFFSNDLKKAHACWVDENGILFLFGFNTYTGLAQAQRGAMLFDLNIDPDNPQYLGQFNDAYIHDGFVRGDTLWASEVYDGKLVIYNVTNPNSFVQLGEVTTPLAFTHNSWPTSDNHFVFTTDELANSSLTSYDVSNIGNITELDKVQSNPGSQSVIHNVHLYNNDFAVASYYRDGVTIFDVSDPNNMIEVGSYDTSPLSGFGYDGDWGVYPFLPSGNLIVSDMQGGLFAFSPHYQKACRIQGTVTDSITTALLNSAKVRLILTSVSDSTNYLGFYRTGILNQGLYDLKFSHPGYITKIIPQVQLDSAQTVVIDAQLNPDHAFDISITVIDSATGQPIQFAKSFINDNFQYKFSFTGDANGVVTMNQIYGSTYDLYIGAWGYMTKRIISISIDSNTANLTVALPKKYYDDFFFDFNWTVTGNATTGLWERGVPVGTSNGSHESNAGADVLNDFGIKCFVTGNSGGSAIADDVDNGAAILTSPVFDLSSSFDPRINCYTWFYDGVSNGSSPLDDSLSIFISNGDSTKLVDITIADSTEMSQWLFTDFRIRDFVELSANMHFIVRTADQTSNSNICEGGLDFFTVVDTAKFNSVSELNTSAFKFQIYPNPVSTQLTIDIPIATGKLTGCLYAITDLSGKIIQNGIIHSNTEKISVTDLTDGIYLLHLRKNESNSIRKICVIK